MKCDKKNIDTNISCNFNRYLYLYIYKLIRNIYIIIIIIIIIKKLERNKLAFGRERGKRIGRENKKSKLFFSN